MHVYYLCAMHAWPHDCPGACNLTVVWGCKQEGGGAGPTHNLGGSVAARLRAPPPAGHCLGGGGMLGQDECRGLAFCEWVLGYLCPCPLWAICSPWAWGHIGGHER